MTTEQTAPIPPVSTPEPVPALKKQQDGAKILSIAIIAAGIACVLAATFGAGVYVGLHDKYAQVHRHHIVRLHDHQGHAPAAPGPGQPGGSDRDSHGDWNEGGIGGPANPPHPDTITVIPLP